MSRDNIRLTYVDMHTAGEPVRIVTGGYPELKGVTILEKRRDARETHDRFRRALMWEPRGHAGMYGVIPVPACHPEAAFGVLFTHVEGYSTMCGHATIAMGRYAVERGLAPAVEPMTRFILEAPCGLLRLSVEVEDGRVGRVSFENVPAFVSHRDLSISAPDFGPVVTDISYGGAFYCILPASRFGLDLMTTPIEALVAAAGALTDAVRAHVPIRHPAEPDLGFLYGAILTDEAAPPEPSFNLCVFAERQIDRSPTGSGVTARMALDHAKGLIGAGVERVFRGITGEPFGARIVGAGEGGVTVEVSGHSHFCGEGSFVIEAGDPLGWGFELAKSFGDLKS